MQRPPWLRWQPIRFSPWLNGSITVSAIVFYVLPVFWEWHRAGGSFRDAMWAFGNRLLTQPPSHDYLAAAIAATILLIWFTYFSGSRHVKDHDRFAVFLMLCGAAVGWIRLIVLFGWRQL